MSSARLAIAALALATPILLGGTCGGGGGGGGGGGAGSPPPAAIVEFQFDATDMRVGHAVQVSVVATTTQGAIQAFDIGVRGPTKKVVLYGAAGGVDFDDDGKLFTTPVNSFPTGEITRIVDLRHGANALSGTVEIARFTLLPIAPTQSQWLDFGSVHLADALGREFAVTAIGEPMAIAP